MPTARWILQRLDDRTAPAVFGNPWPDPNLTLSFVTDGTSVNGVGSVFDSGLSEIPLDLRRSEILRAFQAWIAVANVNVGLALDGGQPVGTPGTAFNDPRFGDVRIAAVPLAADNLALALPYSLAAGTRAGDIAFNSDATFTVDGTGPIDFYSVALHEAGHVFGLAPSADPASAMYQFALAPRIGPIADDIAAIRRLYGPRLPDAFEGPFGNASLATASEVRPEGGEELIAFAADLSSVGDVDVFRFETDNLDGAFLAELTTSGISLLVPSIEILDANGTVLGTLAGGSPGSSDLALRLDTLEKDETYYARVRSADPVFSVGAYRLVLRPEFVEEDDDEIDDRESGEDDTPETSDTLGRLPTLDGTRENFFTTGSLATATDVDFYRVRSRLPSGANAGTLTASVVGTGGGAIDPVIEIFDEALVRQPVTVVVRDGGETGVQLPNTIGNRDYFIAVRRGPIATATAGNYSLGIDIGGAAAAFDPIADSVLTAAAPAATSLLSVPVGQVLHVILSVADTAVATAVRLSIFDSANRAIDTRRANDGDTATLNVFLPPGEYTILVGGGTTNGGAMPNIAYTVSGLTLSDPIGPQAVEPGTNPPPVVPPPPPPPVGSAPVRPATPTVPVAPTDPNFLLLPPADQPIAPTLRLRPVSPAPARTFSFGMIRTGDTTVSSFNPDGSSRFELVPFAGFAGAIRVAEADFNDDGIADLLAGTGPGSPSAVRLIDGRTQGVLFAFAPFESSFTGGVFVAAGDVTGDGRADLIVTPDEGGGPRVRVFTGAGFAPVADFFGIDDPNFRGGARAAVGDLNADGTGDLLVAAGFAGGPRVAGYDGAALAAGRFTRLFGDFFAFEETLRNGVYLAVADVTGDGFADLVAGGGPGGGPRVLALDGRDLLANRYAVVANFFAGDPTARDGVRLAAKNLNNDGFADLVASTGSRVLGYSGASFSTGGSPAELVSVAADGFLGGIDVG